MYVTDACDLCESCFLVCPAGAIYEDEEAAQCTGAIEHIALDVNDIEEAYRFALSRGMKCLDDEIRFLPYWEKGIRYFTLEGPNREKVELSQILK